MPFPIAHIPADLRYSFRTLRRSPAFAIVAILAVAFGIGVNSAIFTLLNAITLRPLPVKDSGSVVTVFQFMSGVPRRLVHGDSSFFSHPEYAAYRDQNSVFAGLTAYAHADLTFGGAGARTLSGDLVSCNYFEVVTAGLALGRGFRPEECATPGAGPVVVLSHRFWDSQFASDPGVLGKAVILNGHEFTVVGIAPEGFRGASIFSSDAWAPVSMQEQWIPSLADLRFPDGPEPELAPARRPPEAGSLHG